MANAHRTLLATGKDGESKLDVPGLGKDEALDTAGVVVTLAGRLKAEENRDVFGRLFDAADRERDLRASLGIHAPRQTLASPVTWLSNNIVAARRSRIPALITVGEGLAAYRLAQATSPGSTARPLRNVTVDTLGRIEEFRKNAKQLEIRAFPPGRVDIDDLVRDAQEISKSRRGAARIEEERLLVLDALSAFLIENDYPDVQAFRLLPGSLNQRIPYYAIVLSLTNRKFIVAENPKTKNATYVFEEVNRDAATWEELVQLEKDEIKQFGGRAMNHMSNLTLDDHVLRVRQELVKRILAAQRAA